MAGPLVGTALLFAILFSNLEISPQVPVAVALVLAMFASVVVHLQGWSGPKPVDRAVDYAWSWLAPRLHFGDKRFLERLAVDAFLHEDEHRLVIARLPKIQPKI